MVTRQNGYHGSQLRATHGITQGGITSATLFNVEVDSFLSHWLFLMVEDEVVIQE